MERTGADPTTVLAEWRARTLQGVLTTTSIAAAVAYVPGALAAARDGLWSIVALDTVAWGAVVVLALWRSLPYEPRAAALLVLWFAFSVGLTVLAGPMGAGIAWLLATPVLGALLFGQRVALLVIGAYVLGGLVYGRMLATGTGVRLAGAPGQEHTLLTWSASLGSVVFLGILLSLAILHVFRGLRRNARELHATSRRLERALEERRTLERELVATSKARALGGLASGMAHDLNNLLVPMLAAGAAARDAVGGDRQQRERLNLVLTAAERARELAHRILVFGRDADAGRGAIALDAVVEEVATLLHSSLPHGVELRTELGARDADVVADAGEIHQILMNLCTNAVRAVRTRGGTLTVTTYVDRPGGAAYLEVRDDGEGVPADLLDRVFDPYVTTHASGDGTGLGLAIVQHLVESLGGVVSLSSTVGEGTVATVRLPLAAAPVNAPDGAGSSYARSA